MQKINGGYQSLFEYLVDKDIPLAYDIDAIFYPEEHSTLYLRSIPYYRRYNENPYDKWTDQFIGALQPIASMAHDAQYTFKPYKSLRDFLMDIAQPLRGLGNILRGLANIVAIPLVFLGNTVRYALFSDSLIEFNFNMKLNFGKSTSWLIDGLSSIVRGTTQVIATPLTWTLKAPLRGIITAITGAPNISENEEIQHLIALGDQAIKNKDKDIMNCIKCRLHEEYRKSASRGQNSTITLEQEKKAFEAIDRHEPNWINTEKNSLDYLGLFRNRATNSSLEHSPQPQETIDPRLRG